jgi:V/A-type H+-transporting ATPase subunit K
VEKTFVMVSAAFAIGISAIATAWVQSRIGAAGAGALAEKPELRGAIIVMLAIPETLVILGFVVAVLMLTGG